MHRPGSTLIKRFQHGFLLTAIAFSMCPLFGQESANPIRFCSGRMNGNYNRLATRISQHPSLSRFQLQVKTTEGSYENAQLLRSGECDIALLQSDVAFLEHWNGRPFRALAPLYTEVVHAAARRELGFDEITDLLNSERALLIGIGEEGSGSASHALAILDELERLASDGKPNWESRYIRLDEAVQGLRQRTLDVVFVTSAIPVRSLKEAADDQVITLLEIDQQIIRQIRAKSPFLVLSEIPYQPYSGKRNIASLGVRALLVLSRKASDDLAAPLLESVYSLAGDKSLPFLADLSPTTGLEEVPIPTHPTSIKFHEQHRAALARFVQEYKNYIIPVVVLVIPFLLLRSRTALFIHQFMLLRIFVLLLCVWLGGASTMFLVEGTKNTAFNSFWKSAIAILHYLFSGLESKYPITTEGTVVSIVILSLGAAVVALFTATVVSLLVEQAFGIQRLRAKPSLFKLRGHVVIAGWSKRAERIIRQLRSNDLSKKPPVLVITSDKSKTNVRSRRSFKNVWVVEGACCDRATLKRADVTTARFALVLNDDPHHDQSGLLAVASTLAIEDLAPNVYTMAEANTRTTVEHLKACKADEVINVADLSGKLIAQVLITPRIMRVFDELLTFARGSQEFYFVPVPKRMAGSTFAEIQGQVFEGCDAVAVGFRTSDRKIVLNPRKRADKNGVPTASVTLREDDRLLVMADDSSALRRTAFVRVIEMFRNPPREEKAMPSLEESQATGRRAGRKEVKVGICGWNPESRDIIGQLQAQVITDKYKFSFKIICPPKTTLAEESEKKGAPQNVSFVFGDPLKRETLKNAGVSEFRSLVIVADRSTPEAAKYSDHRSLMVALAARELNKDLHLVVEVLESENREHFQSIKNLEIVSVEDLAEKIMAQTVISPGITEVFERLLTATKDTNEIYLAPVPEPWLGKTFSQVYQAILESRQEVCLLGYESLTARNDRVLILNPSREQQQRNGAVNWREYAMKEGDSLVVMAYEFPDW